jgi:hypothetical protein
MTPLTCENCRSSKRWPNSYDAKKILSCELDDRLKRDWDVLCAWGAHPAVQANCQIDDGYALRDCCVRVTVEKVEK